jgi:DNA replication protein DnaC
LPLEQRAAYPFFQVVNPRYDKNSLLITSNQHVSEWGIVFGDKLPATAILDRGLFSGHLVFGLKGGARSKY